jgi:hypothetical protein
VEVVSNDLLEPSPVCDIPMSRSEIDWKEIFQALARGNTAALEVLYDAVAAKLYGLAMWRTGSAEDAADVVHDVFVRVVDQGPRLAKVRKPKAVDRWMPPGRHGSSRSCHRRSVTRST